jgi:hypothetical protein
VINPRQHPVDALKALGMPMTAEQEATMRAICDEEVFACGCSVKDGHVCECQEAKVTAE